MSLFKNSSFFAISLLIFFFGTFLIYFFEWGGNSYYPLTGVLYLVASFLPVLATFAVFSLFGFSGTRSRSIIFIALGFFAFFIGEVIFFFYNIVLETDPFPSVADIYYLLAYPFFLVGYVKELTQSQISWNLKRSFLVALFVLILGGLVSYFGIYLAYDVEAGFWINFVSMAYGIGDVILVVVLLHILFLTMEYRGGKVFRPWLFIFLGNMAILVADILFAIYYEEYTSHVNYYKLMDSFWIAGYLMVAYGFFDMAILLKSFRHRIQETQI